MKPHKTHDPMTFDTAVLRIMGVLGPEYVAEILGGSPALAYAWIDPNSNHCPDVEQALKLDAAMQSENGETPLMDVYERQLRLFPLGHAGKGLSQRMSELITGINDLANAQRLSMYAKKANGEHLTPGDYADLSWEVAEAIEALQRYQRDLDASQAVECT